MILYVLLATTPYRHYEKDYTDNVKKVSEFCDTNKINLNHFHNTCPTNPNVAPLKESWMGNPKYQERYNEKPDGLILDLVSSVALWVTYDEYEIMFNTSKNPHEISAEKLDSLSLSDFRGAVVGTKYNI